MMGKIGRQKLAVLSMSLSVTLALGQRPPDIPVQLPQDPNVMRTAAILGLDLRIQALQAIQKIVPGTRHPPWMR